MHKDRCVARCAAHLGGPSRPPAALAVPRSCPLASRLLEGLQVYLPAGQFSTLLDKDALRVSFNGKESAKPPLLGLGSSGDDDDTSAAAKDAAKHALRVHRLSRAQALLTPNYAVLDTLVRPAPRRYPAVIAAPRCTPAPRSAPVAVAALPGL